MSSINLKHQNISLVFVHPVLKARCVLYTLWCKACVLVKSWLRIGSAFTVSVYTVTKTRF